MPLTKAAVGLALVAAGTAACLGNSLAQLGLLEPSWAAPTAGQAWALARYEGWLTVLFAQCIACLAVAGITGLGSSKAIGPNVQLTIFHDANAIVGMALAIALHGSGAAWPMAFLCAGKLLVAAAQALRLPRSVAATAVGLFCGVALGLTNLFESASLTFWAEHLLGAGSPWLKTAAALDRFGGVAPTVFGVGVTFRYTLMRYFSWAIDNLFGSVAAATHPGAVDRAYSDQGGVGAVASPRIGAVGGLASPEAASAFDRLAARMGEGGGAWWRGAARLAGCVLFAEALRRTFFTDSTVHTLLAAQPWHAFAVGYALLTALFAQNFVPWTFARLAASCLGIATVDEAPVGYLRSSVTPRTFWRNYHVRCGRSQVVAQTAWRRNSM
ncbi:hypothetical protein COHA_008345 [Chlorella ohadii]|uniref:Uncharacterized protein n=1 Tax=Chlorella ohadii TaxID=2649997 RepID=A0AAD5H1P4_9CHLO|nr:hypothetical protein COHA_008345 [Chlorella ohadii]